GLAVDGDRDVLGAHRAGLLRVREGAFGGAAEGPEGQLRGPRPLVFDRPADVADGTALGPRRGAGLAEEVVGWRIAREDPLGIGRRERRVGDASEADPGPFDVAVGPEPDDRRDPDRREVADLAL